MRTQFELGDAHPAYRLLLPLMFGALADRYPQVELRRVYLFRGTPADHSLGNADKKGEVGLNPFWFSAPPAALIAAAQGPRNMPVGNGLVLAYHGDMVREPDHLVTHEFAHVLSDFIPGWAERADRLWHAATEDPELAPSAYACTNASEHWAELFTAYEMGVAIPAQETAVREMLGGS